jgi:hypothetical protein
MLKPSEEAEVLRCAEARKRMTNKALSARYGVSISAIANIIAQSRRF